MCVCGVFDMQSLCMMHTAICVHAWRNSYEVDSFVILLVAKHYTVDRKLQQDFLLVLYVQYMQPLSHLD